MMRDMELIRQILLQVEANDDPQDLVDPVVAGRSEQEISYHVKLAQQAGLVDALDRSAIGIFRWSANRLTWAGHEFLNSSKDEHLWRQCLGMAGGASASNFEVLRQLLIDAQMAKRSG